MEHQVLGSIEITNLAEHCTGYAHAGSYRESCYHAFDSVDGPKTIWCVTVPDLYTENFVDEYGQEVFYDAGGGMWYDHRPTTPAKRDGSQAPPTCDVDRWTTPAKQSNRTACTKQALPILYVTETVGKVWALGIHNHSQLDEFNKQDRVHNGS